MREYSYAGRAGIRGKTEPLRLILLSLSLGGLQFAWSAEQVFFMNYMISIGMSKAAISLVWLAGPISGLIGQPLFGALSDTCKSPLGRRRPFMIFSAAFTALALLTVGWSHDIFYSWFSETVAYQLTIASVVVSVFVLDVALNAAGATCRCLVVDSLPADRQEAGQAYASRVIAICHLSGYALGYIHLKPVLGFLGDSQFKIVLFLSALLACVGMGLTCWAVEERRLVSIPSKSSNNLFAIGRSVWRTMQTMPVRIRTICLVQVLAWHGWFPFLFYSSTWIGEVSSQASGEQLDTDTRSRLGSLGLLIFSCMTVTSTIILPKLTRAPSASTGLTLSQLWAVGHFVFAAACISAPLVGQLWQAYVVVALCGFSWALTNWAPFSLIGEEIARSSSARLRRNSNLPTSGSPTVARYEVLRPGSRDRANSSITSHADEEDDVDVSYSSAAPLTSSMSGTAAPGQHDEAGSILGIHNIAICVPQFIITFISSVIFRLMESKGDGSLRGDEGAQSMVHGNSISVVMAVGGMFAIGAGIVTWKRL
ncbi:hypothetical protein PYCC9005_002909 [Savitreella phatthalungensis]